LHFWALRETFGGKKRDKCSIFVLVSDMNFLLSHLTKTVPKSVTVQISSAIPDLLIIQH